VTQVKWLCIYKCENIVPGLCCSKFYLLMSLTNLQTMTYKILHSAVPCLNKARARARARARTHTHTHTHTHKNKAQTLYFSFHALSIINSQHSEQQNAQYCAFCCSECCELTRRNFVLICSYCNARPCVLYPACLSGGGFKLL
jgi:hypothetical protein